MSAEPEKLAELARSCAQSAAAALGDLLGAELRRAAPRSWILQGGLLPAELFGREERVAVVLAQLEGALQGRAALILRGDVLEWVVGRLTGDADTRTLGERALSALCELGNIAVSAAANALSECAGGAVLPSVPRLGFEKPARSALEASCGDLGSACAYAVEAELVAPEGPRRLLFVWIPA